MRGLITAGFLLLLSLAGVRGAQEEVRFDLFLGIDGVVPAAAWFPATFEIRNDSPTFTGRVEIEGLGSGEGAVRTITVELPRGTTKRLEIPIHGSGPYRSQWHARLVDERGRVRATANAQPRRRMPWNASLIGSLARTVASGPALPRSLGSQEDSQAVVVRLVPDLFPQNPLLLESLETIYLNSQRAVELKAPQVNALIAWMYGGGTLVVTVEQTGDLAGAPWLARLLPGTPGQTVQAHVSAGLEDFATREWPALPTASPPMADPRVDPRLGVHDESFATAEVPLLEWRAAEGAVPVPGLERGLGLVASRGRGRIVALAFNPEREPFLSWSHRPWFWGALCGVKSQVMTPNRTYASSTTDAVISSILETTQVRKLPLGWLLVLLLLYLAMIGPFDRWWLRRLGQPMLTWITFPCYVLGFSVVVYLIGYRLRAGDTEWNEVQFVDLIPYGAQSQTWVRSYGSLYSPSNQRYSFANRKPNSAFRGEVVVQGGSSLQGAAVAAVGGGFESSVPVPVWTSQFVAHDSWSTNAAPLRVQLAGPVGSRKIIVENDTGHSIERAWLIEGRNLQELRDLPPGRSDRPLDPPGAAPYPSIEAFVGNFQAVAVRVTSERQHAFGHQGENLRLAPFEACAFASFSRMVRPLGPYSYERFASPGGLDLSELVGRGRPVILAWVPEFLASPEARQFKAHRSHRYTLFRVVLPSP
jgi:hypothetical protein